MFGPWFFSPAIDDEEEVKPPPRFEVRVECVQMFFSAEWTLKVTLNDIALAESPVFFHPLTSEKIAAWTRSWIRNNYEMLCDRGVDACAEYEKCGGKRSDLTH
jgi:hypothetical protein